MRKLLSTILETLFPERPDHKIVRTTSEDDLASLLRVENTSDFVALLPFEETLVRAVVHEAKFQRNDRAWRLLAAVLANYLKHCQKGTLVVPVPLSLKRRWKRGYNQVGEVVRRAAAKAPQVTVAEHLLIRVRETAPQTSLTRVERLENVKEAFRLVGNLPSDVSEILIIDDVATTGATLRAAKDAFRGTDVTVTCLSLAH